MLDINHEGGFSIFKILHTLISLTFLVIAIWLFIRSYNGIYNDKAYTRKDKLLSFGFIISLYLQLIFGLFLFSNIDSYSGVNYLTEENSMKFLSKRLWPVEHIVLMLFALLIANLGLIISLNTKSDINKHKHTFIYYAIAMLLIFYSLLANFL